MRIASGSGAPRPSHRRHGPRTSRRRPGRPTRCVPARSDPPAAAVTEDRSIPAAEVEEEKKTPELAVEDQVFISNLPTILEEFFNLYINTVKKKAKVDPVSLMCQRIIVRADEYPFLDPFNPPFDYSNGVFVFTGTDNAFGENTAKAIMECSWDVVVDLRLEKKFRTVLSKWNYKISLEERGYTLIK